MLCVIFSPCRAVTIRRQVLLFRHSLLSFWAFDSWRQGILCLAALLGGVGRVCWCMCLLVSAHTLPQATVSSKAPAQHHACLVSETACPVVARRPRGRSTSVLLVQWRIPTHNPPLCVGRVSSATPPEIHLPGLSSSFSALCEERRFFSRSWGERETESVQETESLLVRLRHQMFSVCWLAVSLRGPERAVCLVAPCENVVHRRLSLGCFPCHIFFKLQQGKILLRRQPRHTLTRTALHT